MKALKVSLIFLFVGLLLIEVMSFFNARDYSYQKYLDGEYFFRYHAVTTGGSGGIADPSRNPYELRTQLLNSSNVDVYICDPHDQVCTVYYNNTEVEDFPIVRLSIDEDDTDYFLGREVYTKKEYLIVMSRLTAEDIEAGAVSPKEAKDPSFKGFTTDIYFMVSTFAVITLILCAVCKMNIGFYINVAFLVVINLVWASMLFI